jgi:hypothetical protein
MGAKRWRVRELGATDRAACAGLAALGEPSWSPSPMSECPAVTSGHARSSRDGGEEGRDEGGEGGADGGVSRWRVCLPTESDPAGRRAVE